MPAIEATPEIAREPALRDPSAKRAAPRLSIAAPVYNESENLAELVARIRAVAEGLDGGPHELILVDDGSDDSTQALLADVEPSARLAIVTLELSRNFGHQAALSAALDAARGDAVVLMDGDLQDPPELIPRFVELYREGYDVVFAIRRRREATWALRIAYALSYRLIRLISDFRLPLDSGDFSLMARPVVAAIQRAPESHRYLRGLRAWVGFRQIGVETDRSARSRGATKYSAVKLFRLAADGIFSFSQLPLRFASLLGGLTVLGCGIYGAWALFARLFLDRSPRGFTALILTLIFVSGIQMLFLGVIGEYVGRIHSEVKRRPLYLVRNESRKDAKGE